MKILNNIISLTLLIGVLTLVSCKNEATIIGHWKCDTSGTITVFGREDKTTKPITEFYKAFEMPPLEWEFMDDGTLIKYNSKTTHHEGGEKTSSFKDEKVSYIPNYENDKNKIMIMDKNGKEESLLTIKSMSDKVMEFRMESLDDDVVLELRMDRIR